MVKLIILIILLLSFSHQKAAAEECEDCYKLDRSSLNYKIYNCRPNPAIYVTDETTCRCLVRPSQQEQPTEEDFPCPSWKNKPNYLWKTKLN